MCVHAGLFAQPPDHAPRRTDCRALLPEYESPLGYGAPNECCARLRGPQRPSNYDPISLPYDIMQMSLGDTDSSAPGVLRTGEGLKGVVSRRSAGWYNVCNVANTLSDPIMYSHKMKRVMIGIQYLL
ncbi:unnamed protein product [Bursaphelenchus xylophilus]|uniref:(pine wood nematode) hypothetical protein n=1 Tax=Bursaphelenchus xylophilus TaxID=6326 RepID=A0A1I7RZB3_BURXY|nr:unnamed protein product [Bursaphelenchus xylophilus]CAG9106653.1 unnamed protein product [Bursaphelenchus xylophilus]